MLTEEEKREREKARQKKYRVENREKVSAFQKKWRAENREKQQRYFRAYREKNSKILNTKSTKYYYEHKEAARKRQNKHFRKGIECLSDRYVKKLLIQNSTLTISDIPQLLIEAKRLEIKIKRYIKEQEDGTQITKKHDRIPEHNVAVAH